jgi:hypothetical protein
MQNISSMIMKKFLREAGERLSGEWLLLGGALLPALGIESRVTVDIDFIRISKEPFDPTLDMLKLSEKLGLPAGTINQAALIYVQKIKNYLAHLVEFYQGTKSTIFRPDATLFVLLKMKRMSESDLNDCMDFLKYAKKIKEKVDVKRLRKITEESLSKQHRSEKTLRIQRLNLEIGRLFGNGT